MLEKIRVAFRGHTKQKITAVIFMLFIFGMLLGMCTTIRTVGANFLTTYRTAVPTGAPYSVRIAGAIDAMDSAVNEGAFRRQDFIELYGLAQLVMDKHIVTDYNYGSLYKTTSGQTTFAVSEKYVDDACMSLYGLVNALREDDIPFLYIQLPFKVAPEQYRKNSELPATVHDYSNENADNFVSKIEAAGVDAYDIRKDFWESGLSQNELFFDTDHHWTIQGAFTATRLIANKLHCDYGFSVDPDLYTMKNFNAKTYKDSFLGSMGRRVGRLYGGVDDFTLITPKFETDFTLTQVGGEQSVLEGSFYEAVLETDYIDNPDITTNRYAVYHGDYEELQIVNNSADNDDKLLIIKDSFSLPLYCFLSLGIKEVRAIDMRLFNRNVAEYAEEFDPDLVVLMYNADSYSPEMFDFGLTQ